MGLNSITAVWSGIYLVVAENAVSQSKQIASWPVGHSLSIKCADVFGRTAAYRTVVWMQAWPIHSLITRISTPAIAAQLANV